MNHCSDVSIGVQSYSNSYFGEGVGSIILNDVACSTSERRLVDCSYESDTAACSHSQDAGVMCQLCKLMKTILLFSILMHNPDLHVITQKFLKQNYTHESKAIIFCFFSTLSGWRY